MNLYRIYEFLFDRWTVSILEEGEERRTVHPHGIKSPLDWDYKRNFIKYKLTNKFSGSVKIKKKYLN